MACTTQSIISANSCVFPSPRTFRKPRWVRPHTKLFAVNASSGSDDSDCNAEECAPDKEPAVYVADSAISSGTAGTSTEGSENTLAINAGLALISIAAASSILLQVSKSQPQVQTTEYSGPPLSYYIDKFKPVQIIEASAPAAPQTSAPVEASVPPESSSSSTGEALVPTSESPLSTTMQDGSKPEAVPEVQVELSGQVAQSASASSVS